MKSKKQKTKKNRKKNTISVVIIAKNEEEKIGDALRSVDWADEIIVVDSGSMDKTVNIAKKNNARVVLYEEGSYNDWRNKGLNEAKGEWILYLDADERITPSLKEEIVSVVTGEDHKINAYAIPRKNFVLGKQLKYGGFGKFDYVKRLFKRDKLKEWTGELHEEPNFYHKGQLTTGKSDEVGHLTNKMIHLKADTISQMVEKTNRWSAVEAKLMLEANHPTMNTARFLSAMFREFWFRFIREKAFMDGIHGMIHGFYQVYSRFLSYAKLWEMQLNNSKIKSQESKT